MTPLRYASMILRRLTCHCRPTHRSAANALALRARGPPQRELRHPSITTLPSHQIAASFEHYVGAQQKRLGNLEADCLRSLELDGQLEVRGLTRHYVC